MPTKTHTLSTEDRKKLDVSDDEREQAFHRIKAAAKKFGVDMKETSWKQLGKSPHTPNPSHS